MNFNYGIVCTILSTVGSYYGTHLIQKYLERTKKNSVLVLTLAAVLAISTILVPGHTFLEMLDKYNKGFNIFEIKSPC